MLHAIRSLLRPFTRIPAARACGAALLLTAATASVRAQSATYGALAGVVVDAAGRPIADASVRVVDRASGATRRVVTPRDGAFRFGVLGPAEYDVAVEALGYRPVVHVGVGVAAGATPSVRVVLAPERPPVTRVDTVRAAGTRVEPGTWLASRGYAELVGGRRLASDAAGLSTIAGDDAIEGLPWRYADLLVDGMRLGAVGAQGLGGNGTLALGLPSRALSAVTVGGTGFDAEMGGSGVGLSALSLRGGGVSTLRAAAFGGTADLGGGLALGGPIQGDTAQAIVGADYQYGEVSRPEWFAADDAEGLAIVAAARDQYGRDLSGLVKARGLADERRSGYARLDWQVGDDYAILARAAGSRVVTRDLPLLAGLATPGGVRREATVAQASVSVLARLSRRFTTEVRFAGDVGDASSDAPEFDATAFAGRGLVVGGAGDEPAQDQRTALRATGLLHLDAWAHRLKAGGLVATHRLESQWPGLGASAFAFGDAADFAAGTGAWRGVDPQAGSGDFRMVERALFVQDGWQVTDGLAVTLGLRLDGTTIPVGDIGRSAAWEAASGLAPAALESGRTRLAPRVGFRWEMGRMREWVFSGGAGVYHDLPDRRDLADALAYDTGVGVRSAVGALGPWPQVPAAAVARGDALALLGPDFEGPRTRRMTFGVQRDAGPWTVFARGTYRYTDFLSRRSDLNLAPTTGSVDQFGRALAGPLQQVGTLVVAVPGGNRRFAGFDAVTAIEATGFSEFTAVTAGIERVVPAGLSYGVTATYSRTRDNLAGGLAPLAALPLRADGRPWGDGTADTDVPLRVLAAAEWSATASGAVRLGVIYRGRSGTPFTAGFRPGVDANGDGVAGNDPAFVDAAVAGMDALLEAHDCLRADAGRFATRNRCRGDFQHGVDARATFRIASLGAGPLDLVIDAMDLLTTERGRLDGALYLVDRTGTLTTNPATGVTTVPLVANPGFGTVVADRAAGPLFRVGLRIGR